MSEETITMSSRTSARASFARPGWRVGLALLLAFATSLLASASASAAVEITEFTTQRSDPQAGAHPDLITKFKLADAGNPEVARDISASLPAGIFGNPGAAYRCRAGDFAFNECGAGAQVGLVKIVANYGGDPNHVLGTAPVYNMVTLGDEPARLAFVAPQVNVPVIIPITVRGGSDYGLDVNSDYGLDIHLQGIPQEVPVGFAELVIWGYPALASHDVERFHPGEPGNPPACIGALNTECLTAPYAQAGVFVAPFIDNPSVCTGDPMPVTLRVTSYQDPAHTSTKASDFPATTGCEQQKFDPVFNLGLTTNEADAPSGLDLQLRANQFLFGEGAAPSELRSATLTLPPGLSVNPDAADGQSSCTDAEAGFGINAPGHCPDNAKIGTLEVHTPALESPLLGSLYIGQPKPGDQYRFFMLFDGYGIHAKLLARATLDPRTGQVTMSVQDLPQVPFEEFDLHLFASDRGLVATPTHCSIYNASGILVPWNGALAPQRSAPDVSVTAGPNGQPCPGQVRPFAPRLAAGTSTPVAGAFSSFTLKLDRDDGDQFLGELNFRMPPGFTGSLRGIDYCAESAIVGAATKPGREEQAHPSCPVSAQIGTTNVAAGPGSHPFHAVGKMYLAGPFQGAPLSLVAITPALAGPYDYGVVVVRVALNVDPLTAQVSAVSDTMPKIIGGIPIRMRSIQVNIDKPGFTINPTNCSPFSVDSQGIGDQGTVADFSSYFQAVDCRTLGFKPRLAIRQLGGRKQTLRSHDPALRFDLWTRRGDANLKSVAVTLPKAWAIDQRHLGNICSRSELAAKHCDGRQAIGTVQVDTPLLDQPLKGPAYAVSGFGKLPHLAFILAGQVTIIPEAESSSVGGGHLRTVVPVIPDAPVGHFRLTLFGGGKGYLVNTRALCAAPTVTAVRFDGQNGKRLQRRVKVTAVCSGA